jgi:pyruvate-formate lyase
MVWVLRRPLSHSGWTIETLLEYINARIADMELRQQQRFDAQTKAIDAAIVAQRAAVDAALIAANQATAKSEAANEIRFKSVNEFRQALSDQAGNFITRKEAEAMAERNAERISDVTTKLSAFVPRDIVMAEYDRISTQVQDIADRLTRSEGKGAGINALWVYILGAVAAVGTIVSLYVAYK